MKSNHKAVVVRIPDALEKHPNADSLSIVRVGGYQCIVRTDQTVPGSLAVYIQPDSVVPQTEPFRFIWEQYQVEPDGEVPEKRRRIKARKLRKEWSEGLLMPITDFVELFDKKLTYVGGGCMESPGDPDYDYRADLSKPLVSEGDDVAEKLGITHYEPPEDPANTRGENQRGPQYKRFPRSFKGWVYWLLRKLGFDDRRSVGGNNMPAPSTVPPVYDVEAFKNFSGAFVPGEEVVVTEKIHGSNARFTFSDGKMYAGSRQLWKAPKSKCIWRKILETDMWIEQWCRAHQGYVLYGEVTPTQGGFTYGTKVDSPRLFVFDIFNLAENRWLTDAEKFGTFSIPKYYKVPELYRGPFDLEVIKKLVDGKSTVDNNTTREGVVIKPVQEREVHGLGRLSLKIVSNEYLEKS